MNKKRLSVLTLSAMSIIALASCGGSAASSSSVDSSEASTSASQEKVTITWWNTYTQDPTPDDTSDDKNYAAYHYVKDVIAAFQKENPNITVNAVYKGNYSNDYGGLASAVDSGLGTGDVPHIASTYGTYAINWIDSLVDVSDHAATLKKDSDFSQYYLTVEAQQYNGKFYSLPYSKSTDALMINKEVMSVTGANKAGVDAGDYVAPTSVNANKAAYAYPTSFEGLMDLAEDWVEDFPRSFSTERDANGYITSCPVIYEDPANLFITLLESKGIPFMTNDTDPVKSVPFLNDAKAKELAADLTEWNHKGLLATKYQFPMINSYSHEYPSTIFGQGKCFAILASTTGAPWMASDGYSVSWQSIPKYDTGDSAKSLSQGPSLCFFKKKNQAEVDASLKFYDFLTNKENGAALAAQTNYFPLRKSSREVESLKTLIDAAKSEVTYESAYADKKANYAGKVFAIDEECGNGNNLFMSPVTTLSGKVRSAVNDIINGLFADTDAKTDEQIDALVEAKFAAAKTKIFS
ncbi:MAG: extracellular solute-binding protein [Bacilli bacterium]|nr:extracellular solute-binding protein [Bacilli bacterium]